MVSTTAELYDLKGNYDLASDRREIILNLTIDKFEDGNKSSDINRVYLLKEALDSTIKLTNPKTGKSHTMSIEPHGAMVNSHGNSIFVAKLLKNELKNISNELLSDDIVIQWNLDAFGFIEYGDDTVGLQFGRISISNNGRTGSKFSKKDFLEKVWEKISGESRFSFDVVRIDPNTFAKVPDSSKEWREMMTDRSQIIQRALRKFESANSPSDFIGISQDIKSALDKMKEITEKDRVVLEGLLFSKLFSGTGVNAASKDMLEGILKIIQGLYKVANQVGHTATNSAIPFTFNGDKETAQDLLYMTAILFNFLAKMV